MIAFPILGSPHHQFAALGVELVEPPPEETRRIKGPFLRVPWCAGKLTAGSPKNYPLQKTKS